MNVLDEADKVSTSLSGAYQMLGELCVVIRTGPDSKIRIICPQMDATVLSEFLRRCADQVFDGPTGTIN